MIDWDFQNPQAGAGRFHLHLQIPAIRFFAHREFLERITPNCAEWRHVGVTHAIKCADQKSGQITGEYLLRVHETTDTDPGLATTKDDYSLEAYILGINHYQIELLANLDQVPESGAVVVVSFPKPKGGSGFPARVFAILP